MTLSGEELHILKGLRNRIKRVTKQNRNVIRWYTKRSGFEGWRETMGNVVILSRDGYERKNTMPDTLEIGVLLVDKASSAPVGLIKFDSSGVLVYQSIKRGLYVFAFKPINKLLNEQWLKEPLYKKHARLLDENKMLPEEVLEREADSCAEFLNSLEGPLTLGGRTVKAEVVQK